MLTPSLAPRKGTDQALKNAPAPPTIRPWFLAVALTLTGISPAFAWWRPDRIVIVIEENHSYDQILGSGRKDAPYINQLAAKASVLPTRMRYTTRASPIIWSSSPVAPKG